MHCQQYFKFKQFDICQDNTAMKVGTDGVLLGAWATHPKPQFILDIGTGTGLIALMMAQKYKEASIHAVEIDKSAFDIATFNKEKSPWKKRIEIIHTPIQKFSTINKYDLIVCNPPFFDEKVMSKTTQRQWARQNIRLNLDDLFGFIEKKLSDHGKFALIFPKEKEKSLLETAKKYHLFPKEILEIRGNKQTKVKRILVAFEKEQKKPTVKELIIEKRRHIYTDEYKKLVKDFYLKM